MSVELLSAEERAFLREAADYLENPSYLMKLANLVGKPLEWTFEKAAKIAPGVVEAGNKAVHKGLIKVIDYTSLTLPPNEFQGSLQEVATKNWWSRTLHIMATTVSGGVGGFFGMPALPIELPITTTIMLRSIAIIANDYGEDLKDPESRLQCLTVLSYGGGSRDDDAMDSTYLSARVGLAGLLRDAAQFVARSTAQEISERIARGTAPSLVTLITRVATRFNIVVSQKALAQSLPVLGAVGGAGVNAAFTDHFHRVARFHFGIRRLQRQHPPEEIENIYREYARAAKQAGPRVFTE